MRTVVVSGVLTCLALVTAAHEALPASASAKAGDDGSNFDGRGSSKAMGEVASHLEDGVAEKTQKLQELESDLKRNQQSAGILHKNVGEVILILNAAANESGAGFPLPWGSGARGRWHSPTCNPGRGGSGPRHPPEGAGSAAEGR